MSEKITADAIETRELRLVDSEGHVRAMLRVGNDGLPAVKLVDTEGNVRLTLAIDDEGKAAIEIWQDGHRGVTLHADQQGGSARVYDAGGQLRIKAEIAELEGPRVEFYSAAGLRETYVPASTGQKLAR